MKILYCASDQTVPGTKGGSVHVTAVADGLAALGHEVHALVTPGGRIPPPDRCGGSRCRRRSGGKNCGGPPLARCVGSQQTSDPDVIIERYYNFGGEGIGAAARVGATAVLEVNAPVIDFPGSAKARLDRALLVEPMRRWRERICARADVIVTPAAAILPPDTPRSKIVEIEWGADTERFQPGARARRRLPGRRRSSRCLPARSAAGTAPSTSPLRSASCANEAAATSARCSSGTGPSLPRCARRHAGSMGIVFTGALPHDRMPASLAACDIGVAPFDVGRHRPLALGFYWSPLKIFEYMASGLPVVAPAADRIPRSSVTSAKGCSTLRAARRAGVSARTTCATRS